MRTTSRGGFMKMFIIAIIIVCITTGTFYTSDKRNNGILVTIKRGRVLSITDKYAPLQKIIITKI